MLYLNGEEFLAKVKEGTVYDIVVLDIIMPESDGIEIGRRLRAFGGNSILIYLTRSKDYAIDSYDVSAYHYLLKPIDREKLFQVLGWALWAGYLIFSAWVLWVVDERGSQYSLFCDDLFAARHLKAFFRKCHDHQNGNLPDDGGHLSCFSAAHV